MSLKILLAFRRTVLKALRKMSDGEEEYEKQHLLSDTILIKPKDVFGTRHVLGIMGFFGFANVYAMRVNLSVAIVAMVNSSAIPHLNTSSPDICPATNVNSSSHMKDGEFVWDEAEQGLILGSFFWGYLITNPIGGRLGELVGGKIVFGLGVLVTALLTLVTPVVARASTPLLIATRVVEGLGEGVTFPAMNSLMARWVPPHERSRMSSLVYSGSQFGTIIALPISGLLCQSSFLGGWPAVFYVFGFLGLIWFVVWMLLIHNDPSKHPRIDIDEQTYIQESLHRNEASQKHLSFPLFRVLNSLPFWAIVVAHFAQNWGFYTLLTELPTYMENILHYDITSNSFISALPYLCMWVFGLASGQIADRLITSGKITTINSRRIFNSIGIYGPMICIVLVGYAGCNRVAAIILLCFAVGLNGASFSGYINSHLDIAPNFAGTLMGMTNCAATVPGFLSPLVVGAIIKGEQTVWHWKIVFWIAGIIYLFGNTFFIIFVSADEQKWNNPPDDTSSSSSTNDNSDTSTSHQLTTFPEQEQVEGGMGGEEGAIAHCNTSHQPTEVFEIFSNKSGKKYR